MQNELTENPSAIWELVLAIPLAEKEPNIIGAVEDNNIVFA